MVLLLAWETWCPTWGFLPVTWQTRAMECSGAKGTDYRATGAPLSSDTLQQAALGKRHGARPGDDEMVEHLDVDERERGFQRSREDLVGVVGREDHGGGVVLERALHDLARIDARLRERAAEKLFRRPHAVLRIKEQHDEDFLFAPREREAQIIAYRPRRGERVARRDLFLQRAARELQRRLELRELGAAQARCFREIVGPGLEQRRDRAEAPEQLPRNVDRAFPLDAGAKQDREQLGIRERPGAERKQPLARALQQGPVGNRHGIRLKSRFAA